MSISFDWKSQYCSKEIAFLFCALFLEANTYLLHSLRAKYSVLGAQPVPYTISTMICIRKRYVKSHEDTGFWCKDSIALQPYQRCNRGELFGATSVMQGQNLPPLVGIRYLKIWVRPLLHRSPLRLRPCIQLHATVQWKDRHFIQMVQA